MWVGVVAFDEDEDEDDDENDDGEVKLDACGDVVESAEDSVREIARPV